MPLGATLYNIIYLFIQYARSGNRILVFVHFHRLHQHMVQMLMLVTSHKMTNRGMVKFFCRMYWHIYCCSLHFMYCLNSFLLSFADCKFLRPRPCKKNPMNLAFLVVCLPSSGAFVHLFMKRIIIVNYTMHIKLHVTVS